MSKKIEISKWQLSNFNKFNKCLLSVHHAPRTTFGSGESEMRRRCKGSLGKRCSPSSSTHLQTGELRQVISGPRLYFYPYNRDDGIKACRKLLSAVHSTAHLLLALTSSLPITEISEAASEVVLCPCAVAKWSGIPHDPQAALLGSFVKGNPRSLGVMWGREDWLSLPGSMEVFSGSGYCWRR